VGRSQSGAVPTRDTHEAQSDPLPEDTRQRVLPKTRILHGRRLYVWTANERVIRGQSGCH
jgi:hypothetical protein